jgi:hypothetical protein
VAVVREYLHAEQLAAVTPWSVDAIEKMVRRGTFRLGVQYFQPHGRGTKLIFKWSAIVMLIESGMGADESAGRSPESGRGIDVEKATTGLRRLLAG